MITMRADVAAHPDAREGLEGVLRSLRNPAKERQRRVFFSGMREVEVFTEAGIYAGDAGTYPVQHERLYVVVERIVKGLFYHVREERLPKSYSVLVRVDSALNKVEASSAAPLRQLVQELLSTRPGVVGDGVFTYWTLPLASDPYSTVWLLVFYRKVFFLAFTAQQQEIEARKVAAPQ